ncbi:MarR family transcriptional regulator [Actinoplanes sp. Pm04-4]|uniref:MarR family transcriptional regulator n=1 Tax=Paractinoplanes pyxinae TaxID=2997416 RepID=A0ABT4B372_9ACTN|nr:MarR family transcriptional regulator [Actinoplanes pyxinae]MCY1140951.1 MarR family transcriptional regulator [Actinoplanes pyxinae]
MTEVNQVQQVVQSLRDLAAAQSDLGRAFARSQRMHPTDATAIVEIINAEQRGHPLTPARLAERIALTTGATSILLNRLEQAGHIARTREHSDRRIVTLRSTSDIHAAAAAFFEPLAHRLTAALADYSPADLQLINSAATRLHSTMTTYMDELDT